MSEEKKRIDFYIDLSNGLEVIQVKFPCKYKSLMEKSSFNYENNYIINNFIKYKDINDYLLLSDYGCKCDLLDENNEIICSEDNCLCVNTHQQKYECNINCDCSDNCSNRVVQKGLNKKLMVNYISKGKGFGVFALEELKKDEFVCEYVGEIIDKNTAYEKIDRNKLRKRNNYVLQVREVYKNMVVNTFIDAEEKGNISRFINHSCDPNMYFDIVRINHFTPQIAFYAKRDIAIGEELTFSYIDGENIEDSDLQTGRSSRLCECKAINCVKFLPGF